MGFQSPGEVVLCYFFASYRNAYLGYHDNNPAKVVQMKRMPTRDLFKATDLVKSRLNSCHAWAG